MTWRKLNDITVAFAVVAAAGAGIAVGTTLVDEDPPERDAAITPASREPLRKTPLLAGARQPRDQEIAPAEDPEAQEARATQLPFPQPSEFRIGTPERALAAFMKAWRERRWSVMETWTATDAGPDATRRGLRRRHGPLRLRGWRIAGRDRAPAPGAYDYDVEIAYRTLLDPVLRRIPLELRVARRTAHGAPSRRSGSWGVDPSPRLGEELARKAGGEPLSVQQLLEDSGRYVQDEVDLAGIVQEQEVLDRDVPATTVLGEHTADHLLVIARDARELPRIEDGARVRVRGEMRILWAEREEDGFVAPGPVIERFRNAPYVFADDVVVLERP